MDKRWQIGVVARVDQITEFADHIHGTRAGERHFDGARLDGRQEFIGRRALGSVFLRRARPSHLADKSGEHSRIK
jgi:hypothetical protein